MLALLEPTSPTWVDAAAADLAGLLSDHAHCELKAAQSALSLIGRYGGEAPALIEPLSELAREETAHFAEVQKTLAGRGGQLGRPRRDDYVGALRAAAASDRQHHHQTPALLDRLLVAALIEGRSCERFKLLSERLPDSALRTFYAGLMASEARHFTLFTSLAADCFGVAESRARLRTLAAREASIAHTLPLGPTVHG
jgi:tRNA-(ms[2]io[6]A)-hydroxylase